MTFIRVTGVQASVSDGPADAEAIGGKNMRLALAMSRRVRACATAVVLALVLALTVMVAGAQAPAPRTAALEPYKQTLDQLEAAVERAGASNDALTELRDRIVPLRDELRAKIEDMEPKLAELDTRLKQLGPAPEEGAPAEEAGLAAERTQLSKQFGEADAALKQAKLLALRLDQIAERIVERRRAIFTRELLHRSYTLLNPVFWSQVADALSYEWRSLGYATEAWRAHVVTRAGPLDIAGAVVTLSLLVTGVWFAAARVRRRLTAGVRPDTRFGKSVRALAVLVGTAAPAPLLVLGALLILDTSRLLPGRIEAIGWGLVVAVAVASAGRAVALSFLAPGEPERRLPGIDDATALALAQSLTWCLRVFGVVIFLNVLHKELFAPVVLTVATSAVLALVIAAALLRGVLKLRRNIADFDHPSRGQWVRMIALTLGVGLFVMTLTGYVGLASFIAGRLVTLVVVFAALYLLVVFTDSVFTEVLMSDTVNGRAVASLLGVRPRSVDVLGMLASGVIRVGLVLAAFLLVIGPWGFFAADFFGALEGAVFGFKIGEITISLTAIFGAIAVLLAGLVLTRALQRWLQLRFLPRTGIESSLQLSITTIVGYVGFIAAVALTMSQLGVDLQKIAIVAGALSVGIGFGLQSIVSNFVSGLILLAERPIRVGDSIVVKGEEGYVRRISVRATEIETFERASVIVPNSELITGVVKNWTHANTTGRIIVKVGVAYESNAEQVRDILLAVAGEHPQILQTPPPRVFLVAFGDNALDFELRCVVANVDYGLSIKSDLHFAILSRFRAAKIDIPYPQREVRVVQDGRTPATLVPVKGLARSAEG